MDDKMLDRIFDNLIEEAGSMAIEKMTEEDLKTLNDASDIKFSKRHEAEMKKIFAEAKRREMMPKRLSMLKRVAVFAAITIVVSGLTIGSVGAWRESFVKYFLDMKEEYSEVNNTFQSYDIIVDNVHFGYIPKEFEYQKKEKTSRGTSIYFYSDTEYFALKIKEQNKSGNKFNTESGDVCEIIVNEKDMIYSENNMVRFLTWNENNCTNVFQSDCDKETMIKIVENIKISP